MQPVLKYLAGGRALLLHTASRGIIAIFILVKGVFYIYSIVQAYTIHVTKIDSLTALWQYAQKKIMMFHGNYFFMKKSLHGINIYFDHIVCCAK